MQRELTRKLSSKHKVLGLAEALGALGFCDGEPRRVEAKGLG